MSQEAMKRLFKPSQNWLTFQKTLGNPTETHSKKRKRESEDQRQDPSREFASAVRHPKLTNYDPWHPSDQQQQQQQQKGNPALLLQPKSSHKFKVYPSRLKNAFNGRPGRYIAIDCEMVQVTGEYTRPREALARVSAVNYYGYPLLDLFVTPKGRVTDFRTHISGIRPSNIIYNPNAVSFEEARSQLSALLKNRILVGHAMYQDLSILQIDHPKQDRRDTSLYPPFRTKYTDGNNPGLRKLVLGELGLAIQFGEHDSVEDAQAAMALYRRVHDEFETFVKRGGQQRLSEIVKQEEEEEEVMHAALRRVSATAVLEEESLEIKDMVPPKTTLSAEKERKIKLVSRRRKFN